LLEALLELRSGEGPASVQGAADRLLRANAPWALDMGRLASGLIASAGDERDQRLLVNWTLSPAGRTFADLGREEDLPRRHVNKLVRQAEARVRQALPASPAPLPWLVSTLRSRLGAIAPAEQVEAELDRFGARKPPAPELLGWLAGPYSPVPDRPGWVAAQPHDVAARTAACLAEDGGVRRLVDMEAELADLGIATRYLVPWLRACGAAVVHDVAVPVNGPLADVVERLLDAYGTARTSEEIAADLAGCGRAVEPAALAKVVGNRRRFARSTAGGVRLAVWGQDEHPPVEKVPRPPLAKLPAKAPAPTKPASGQPGGQDRLWLWVRVDAEVLRGSEAAVPVALVEGLGLAPFGHRTFSGRWGPVTLAHEPPQPTRGAVRAVALAAGARPDDTLLLGFGVRGDLEVEVRRGASQAGPPEVTAAAAVVFPEIVSGGNP
jgi:hypothetical protein